MNALGETCPVCGGRMRQSQYSLICAQEFGPCGLLYHKFSGRNRRGGVTEFEHTTIKRESGVPWTRMRRHYKLAQFYAAGAPIAETVYMERLGGKAVKPAPAGKRAVVVRQGVEK